MSPVIYNPHLDRLRPSPCISAPIHELRRSSQLQLTAVVQVQSPPLLQGCAEIRWLAEKMGAKPATVSGLSGLGDIMLTCYGALSRNRAVGMRLGQGEALDDILASSSQVGIAFQVDFGSRALGC